MVERILPLPKIIPKSILEESLIEATPEDVESIPEHSSNFNCLIRPCLGRRYEDLTDDQRQAQMPRGMTDYLLLLDMLDFDQIQPGRLSRQMAMALATGHWKTAINMVGVKFVLGSRPPTDMTPRPPLAAGKSPAPFKQSEEISYPEVHLTEENLKLPIIQMWMLGFDKASSFQLITSETELFNRGLDDLVEGVLSNDQYPYCYPSRRGDWVLWCDFAITYIRALWILIRKE